MIVKDSEIVGTASLDKDTIYTVFVDVQHHRFGIESEEFGRDIIMSKELSNAG